MTTTSRTLSLALAAIVPLVAADVALGRGGGGARGGGGGGARGGGGGGGAHFAGHTPTFSVPRAAERSAGGFNGAVHQNVARPEAGNRAQAENHMAVGNRAVNANRSNTNVNRANTNVNRANTNVNRANTIVRNESINVSRSANFNGLAGGWRAPYAGYHQGWVNGYWNPHYNNPWGGWGWGMGGFAAGAALGGMTALALSPMLNNWGYSPYVNPYYSAMGGIQQPVMVAGQPMMSPYDYSQPINVQSAPPAASVTDPAVETFDSARAAFQAGDYPTALQLTDQALGKMPNDATLHEFRALVLFAMGQYEQAAVPLYAVLSVGPGWNWTTLISLYPGVDVYTAQLRALENYCKNQSKSASGRFVLAYHYLAQGNNEAAIDQLKTVIQLQPGDKLSAQLLQSLTRTDQPDPAVETETPPAAPAPSPTFPAQDLAGTWNARPAQDTAITLTMANDGSFTWKVTEKGKTRQFGGSSSFGNNLLTLAQTDGNALVGKITWQDARHFQFKAVGSGPDDAGLSFSRLN